jgi:hypothetical protein
VYVFIHIRVTHFQFKKCKLHKCHQKMQLQFLVDVALDLVLAILVGLVEVHLALCDFSVSAVSVLSKVGKDCSCRFDSDKL